MPFCDQCGAENPDWARFCDQCGKALIPVSAQSAPPVSGGNVGLPPAPGTSSQCPQCGASVIPGEAFCDSCGAPLLPAGEDNRTVSPAAAGTIPPQQVYPAPQPVGVPSASTPALSQGGASPAPSAGSGPAMFQAPTAMPGRTTLMSAQLHIPARNISLPLPSSDQALIGRTDAVSGVYPDIDLTPYGGIESGVGRRHLRLVVKQGQIFAEDMNSVNGTFVNGQRLMAGTPHLLKSGDEIRLGTLVMRIQI